MGGRKGLAGVDAENPLIYKIIEDLNHFGQRVTLVLRGSLHNFARECGRGTQQSQLAHVVERTHDRTRPFTGARAGQR